MPTKVRKKNPATEAGAVPFPQMAPDYPFKPWIDRETGETFSTLTVQQDDGSFLCVLADRPDIRFTAKDRAKAEQGLLKLYRERRRNPEEEDVEDEDDLRVGKLRERGSFISLAEFRRRHGR